MTIVKKFCDLCGLQIEKDIQGYKLIIRPEKPIPTDPVMRNLYESTMNQEGDHVYDLCSPCAHSLMDELEKEKRHV